MPAQCDNCSHVFPYIEPDLPEIPNLAQRLDPGHEVPAAALQAAQHAATEAQDILDMLDRRDRYALTLEEIADHFLDLPLTPAQAATLETPALASAITRLHAGCATPMNLTAAQAAQALRSHIRQLNRIRAGTVPTVRPQRTPHDRVNPHLAALALDRAGGDRQTAWTKYIQGHYESTGSLAPGCNAADLVAYYQQTQPS